MQIMQLLNVAAVALPVMALPTMSKQATHRALDVANQAADQATRAMSMELNADTAMVSDELPCCTDIAKGLPHLKVPCSYYETCMKVPDPQVIENAILKAFGSDYMKLLPVCPEGLVPPTFPCKIDDTYSESVVPTATIPMAGRAVDAAGNDASADKLVMYDALPCCSKDVGVAVCKPCKGGPELTLFFDEATGAFRNGPAILDDILEKATALPSTSPHPLSVINNKLTNSNHTDNLISPDDVVPTPTNLLAAE